MVGVNSQRSEDPAFLDKSSANTSELELTEVELPIATATISDKENESCIDKPKPISLENPQEVLDEGCQRMQLEDEGIAHVASDLSMDSRPAFPTIPRSTCSHWSEKRIIDTPIFETILPIKLGDLAANFLNDNELYDIYHIYYTTDPSMLHPFQNYSHTKWVLSTKECCLRRQFNFVAPPQPLPIVGVIRMPVEQRQRLWYNSDNSLVLRTRSQGSGAIYADTFFLDLWWEFTAMGSDSVHLKIIYDLQFVKSCWVKAIISAQSGPPAIEAGVSQGKLLESLARKINNDNNMKKQLDEAMDEVTNLVSPDEELLASQEMVPKKKRNSLSEVYNELTDTQKGSIFGERRFSLSLESLQPTIDLPPNAIAPLNQMNFGNYSNQDKPSKPIKIEIKDLPQLVQAAGVVVVVLVFLIAALFNRVLSLESQNAAFQQEIVRLGPVIGSASLEANKTAAQLWTQLPSSSVARQSYDLVMTYEATMKLLPLYKAKVEMLQGLLSNLQIEQRSHSYSWLLILSVTIATLSIVIYNKNHSSHTSTSV